jgi:hypothetical protein
MRRVFHPNRVHYAGGAGGIGTPSCSKMPGDDESTRSAATWPPRSVAAISLGDERLQGGPRPTRFLAPAEEEAQELHGAAVVAGPAQCRALEVARRACARIGGTPGGLSGLRPRQASVALRPSAAALTESGYEPTS